MHEHLPKYFNLTDRPWLGWERSIAKRSGLSPEYIDDLNPGARILIAGSGIHRSFEKDVYKRRQDLCLVSVDPTLGIIDLEAAEPTYFIEADGDTSWIYRQVTSPSNLKKYFAERTINLQRRRLERILELPGAVAALATHLPFADGSFDMAVDVCGPVMYLPDEQFALYQQELIRVTKPDAMIFSSDYERLIENLGLTI